VSDKPAGAGARPPASKSRRRFITLFAVVGGLLALAPWAGFGPYLSSSAAGSTSTSKPQTIVLDENTEENGKASGKTVNVKDLTTFPPNSTWTMTYPSSGDPSIDGQNPNTFVKFALIRLPKELGGANPDASAFVAFSKVCVHLWCSPNYNPTQSTDSGENGYTAGAATHELYECPCHGSGYSVGLGVNGQGKQPVGVALIGPASVQPPPTNAIPLLTLQTDSAGNLQVVPPVWDVDHNGVVGYGRNVGNGAFAGGYSPQ
jgi:rieske iron-sulfur protein